MAFSGQMRPEMILDSKIAPDPYAQTAKRRRRFGLLRHFRKVH